VTVTQSGDPNSQVLDTMLLTNPVGVDPLVLERRRLQSRDPLLNGWMCREERANSPRDL